MAIEITVLPQNQIIQATEGELLSYVLYHNGFTVPTSCGGQGTCRKCKVSVDGEDVLACQYHLTRSCTVVLPPASDFSMLTSGNRSEYPLHPIFNGYALAFDLGTTSIVCFLLSSRQKEPLATASMLNPQSFYGADVITRLQKATKGDYPELVLSLRNGCEQLCRIVCAQAGIVPEDISMISLVGNPCMQQFFFGMDIHNLVELPYAPVISKADILPAKDYLSCCPKAEILLIPDIAGFVGADTVAACLASPMLASEKTSLLIDIGTNGEMLLYHHGQMVACSTAAGPALEGAGISCGMRSVSGAICHATWENRRFVLETIDCQEPQGICGSGLLDLIALLKKQNFINRRGRILTPTDCPSILPFYRESEEDRAIAVTESLLLTQNDIHQVQLAKGAMAAGLELLCAQLSLSVSDIETIYLAGAFGSSLSPDSICSLGLLPPECRDRIVCLGNAAGIGAQQFLLSKETWDRVPSLVPTVRSLELASLPAFPRCFAQHMTL